MAIPEKSTIRARNVAMPTMAKALLRDSENQLSIPAMEPTPDPNPRTTKK